MKTLPRVVMTIGDPSGIGPELAVRVLASPENRAKADISLIASPDEVAQLSREFGVTIPVTETSQAGTITLVPNEWQDSPVERGVCSV